MESICKESGSKAVAKERGYVNRCVWETKKIPDQLWCEIYNDCAFYMAVRRKNYVRLVFIVVRADKRNNGIGTKLLNRLFERTVKSDCTQVRLRTSQAAGEANAFWLNKQHAEVVGINGNDLELQINLTQ